MSNISKIKNFVQDEKAEEWIKLCEYIDKLAAKGSKEFSPLEYLGYDLFSKIYTLPKSIGKLKTVKKVWLYGSNIKQIPPEIGMMESLEYFDPYTSYDLMWFPYEIIYCTKLIDSRVSTRALYGNYKNRKVFPLLNDNPVRYYFSDVKCSICRKELDYNTTNQLWISLKIGTDILPLLVNLCSTECEKKLPTPPKSCIDHPHKGGILKYPDFEEPMIRLNIDDIKKSDTSFKELKLMKVIKKIWDK